MSHFEPGDTVTIRTEEYLALTGRRGIVQDVLDSGMILVTLDNDTSSVTSPARFKERHLINDKCEHSPTGFHVNSQMEHQGMGMKMCCEYCATCMELRLAV